MILVPSFFIINIKIKYKLLFVFLLSFLIGTIVLSNQKIKERYIDSTINQYYSDGKIQFDKSSYYSLYQSSLLLFKDNLLFGIGPKNFRVECKKTNINNGCSTHPHNTYIQILLETGIIGFTPLIFISYIIFNLIKYTYKICSSIHPKDRFIVYVFT